MIGRSLDEGGVRLVDEFGGHKALCGPVEVVRLLEAGVKGSAPGIKDLVGQESGLALMIDGPEVVGLSVQQDHHIATTTTQLPLPASLVVLLHRGLPVLEIWRILIGDR